MNTLERTYVGIKLVTCAIETEHYCAVGMNWRYHIIRGVHQNTIGKSQGRDQRLVGRGGRGREGEIRHSGSKRWGKEAQPLNAV
jgi:hypothetical protein